MNTDFLRAYLNNGQADASLSMLYGSENTASQRARYEALLDRHQQLFGAKERVIFCSAPGRTEIAGNHTDHNNGRVLAAAIHLDTLAAASENSDNMVRLYSEGYDKPFVVSLDDLTVHSEEKESTHALIRGVAARLKELGKPIGGFDAAVTSTVLKGSGLSSSAAFEVMLCEVFDALYGGHTLDGQERARVSQYAENVYFGKPCGLMDQMASSVGGLVGIDFKDTPARLETLNYNFAQKGYQLAVVSAGGDHGNLTDQYAAIPAEMCSVAKELGGNVLKDIDPTLFSKSIPCLKNKVNDRALLRAIHFFSEDARVPQMLDALRKDDLQEFLKGIIASGESSWMLLQNLYVPGSDNQELALALALSADMLSGRGAWRIHGGGFAGTILCFVPDDLLNEYVERMNAVFGESACTCLSVRPVGAFTLPEKD